MYWRSSASLQSDPQIRRVRRARTAPERPDPHPHRRTALPVRRGHVDLGRVGTEQAREFTLNEVLPVANKLDPEKGDIPMDLRDKMAELGVAMPDHNWSWDDLHKVSLDVQKGLPEGSWALADKASAAL